MNLAETSAVHLFMLFTLLYNHISRKKKEKSKVIQNEGPGSTTEWYLTVLFGWCDQPQFHPLELFTQ